MPAWVTSPAPEMSDDVAFLSGAALSHLHLVCQGNQVPVPLLRDRLALRAAEACVTFAGRPERLSDLRDTIHLVRATDLPGPAGEVCLAWRRATDRPLSADTLGRALPGVDADTRDSWRDAGQGGPVNRAAAVLETVLAGAPRAEVAALILAEAALAGGLRHDHLMPLLAIGIKRPDLRLRGTDLVRACHRAVWSAAVEATILAADLARKAGHMKTVAPKLRAKGSGDAVEMFLKQDALAPSALPLPDRAARRLCDRLVQLGAVRELTGRETFRLYGL